MHVFLGVLDGRFILQKGVDFERHVTECPIHLALLKTPDLMGFKTQIPADREGVNIRANESEFPSLILEHIHEQAERSRRECPTGIFKPSVNTIMLTDVPVSGASEPTSSTVRVMSVPSPSQSAVAPRSWYCSFDTSETSWIERGANHRR